MTLELYLLNSVTFVVTFAMPALFATASMAILQNSGNLIIRCKKFLVDIFVWALAHLERSIELSVAGQIIYQENLGGFRRALLFVIDEDCWCNKQQRSVLDENNVYTITVSESMEGGHLILSEEMLRMPNLSGKRPSTRTALYSLDGYTGCFFGTLLEEERRRVLRASQSVVLWVLKRPGYLCFIGRSNQSIVSKSSDVLIGDMLSRWPHICNERFGGARIAATVTPPRRKSQLGPQEILHQYQETRDVLEVCSSRCLCRHCFSDPHGSGFNRRRGCLKAMAGSEILRLIAHAIADGFGADDTSGLYSAGHIEAATSHLLSDLLYEQTVPWVKWFGLAASVYLGCGTTFFDQERVTFPEVVAMQYGSYVVAAPWIDFSSEVQATASFGFESAQASLCGVDADYAIIITESTACSNVEDLDLSQAKLPRHGYDDTNATEVSLLASIQSTGIKLPRQPFDFFTLLTIAKVGRYTRIIDPTAIFSAIASIVVPRRTHTHSAKPAVSLSSPHRIWSFEEAVGFWAANNFEDKGSSRAYHTTILDSHAKYNTLLALSPQGCVVKMAECCFACAQTQLDSQFPDSKARRILSVAINEKRLIMR